MMSIIDKQILAFAGAPVTPYTHLLSDAVGYMVDNLESDLSLTSVAAHVLHRFLQLLGDTPKRFLKHRLK